MNDRSTVLVTGGAGYIGSHAALRLLEDGYSVVIFDDLSRGNIGAVEALWGALPASERHRLRFEKVDLLDRAAVRAAVSRCRFQKVMHFAALAYVGESVQIPLDYWRVNIGCTVNVLEAATEAGADRFVFSSSCATFGEVRPPAFAIDEDAEQRPINPYGASKLACERVLRDHFAAVNRSGGRLGVAILRYFNVAGSDPQCRIGEHHEPETHLIPIVLRCLAGLRQDSENTLTILGGDYPTPDGTCIRDYIHVHDIVGAHVRVLGALQDGQVRAYNLGIGQGFSVKQVVEAAERVTGMKLRTKFAPRRPGDPAVLYANPAKIMRELGWQPNYPKLEDMIAHAWTWIKSRPQGYGKA